MKIRFGSKWPSAGAAIAVVLVLAALCGCGGGGIGEPSGSPIMTPGTYTGNEFWTSGTLQGQVYSIVAIVASGNRLALSENPGPSNHYTGFAVTPSLDSNGRFTVGVAQGNFVGVIVPAATITGVNAPSAVPQVTGTMTQQGVGTASWSLTLQQGSGNPYAGWYAGSMSAPASTPITAVVGPDGTLVAVEGGQGVNIFCAVGTVSATTGAISFTGTNPGMTLTGTVHAGGTASGTYNFYGVGSGSWTATRQ